MATLVPKPAARKLLVRLLWRGPEGGGPGREACSGLLVTTGLEGVMSRSLAELAWLRDICSASPLTLLFLALQNRSCGALFSVLR